MTLDARTILLLMAFTAVPTALVLLAVSRFYAAKSGGRNRVVAASWLQDPQEAHALQAVPA